MGDHGGWGHAITEDTEFGHNPNFLLFNQATRGQFLFYFPIGPAFPIAPLIPDFRTVSMPFSDAMKSGVTTFFSAWSTLQFSFIFVDLSSRL